MTIQQITKNKNKITNKKKIKTKKTKTKKNKSKVIPVNEYAQYKTVD